MTQCCKSSLRTQCKVTDDKNAFPCVQNKHGLVTHVTAWLDLYIRNCFYYTFTATEERNNKFWIMHCHIPQRVQIFGAPLPRQLKVPTLYENETACNAQWVYFLAFRFDIPFSGRGNTFLFISEGSDFPHRLLLNG